MAKHKDSSRQIVKCFLCRDYYLLYKTHEMEVYNTHVIKAEDEPQKVRVCKNCMDSLAKC